MNSKRILISGKEVPTVAEPAAITVRTHCPDKWLFADLETNDFWVSDGTQFRRAPTEVLNCLVAATWNYLAAVVAAHDPKEPPVVKPMLSPKERDRAELLFFECLLLLGTLGTFIVIALTR